MPVDLSHAKASVNWAIANLDALQERFERWLNSNIKAILEDLDSKNPHFRLVAVQNSPLPLEFSVEVGAYINAIRSSLDILASALAHHYGIPNADKAYFPVASNQAIFESGTGYKGYEFVNGLPADCRNLIESLKPYRGGNSLLTSMHDLDIERKHRQLLSIELITPKVGLANTSGGREAFVTNPGGFQRVDNKTILGKVSRAEKNPHVYLACNIAFDKAHFPRGTRVVTKIQEFGIFASSVIDEFARLDH